MTRVPVTLTVEQLAQIAELEQKVAGLEVERVALIEQIQAHQGRIDQLQSDVTAGNAYIALLQSKITAAKEVLS